MEWYEIVGFIFAWFIGVFIWGKLQSFHKDKYYNDSFKDRKKYK